MIVVKNIWKTWRYGELYMILAAVAAQTINISVGFCQGFSAILLPQLAQNTTGYTTEEGSWIASLGVISNPFGALLGGFMLDYLGRKATLQSVTIPGLTGWLIIALSNSYTTLCIGRFITGFTIGMSTSTYIYVAEISTPKRRGVLAAMGPALVSLGIFIVYVLGSFCDWRTVAMLCAGVSLFNPLLIHPIAESPMWLASKGKINEAYDAMFWLRQNNNIAKQEMDEFSKGNTIIEDNIRKKIKSALSWTALKPFTILIVFFLFQELSGIYIILYYAVDFFKALVDESYNEFTVSMIVGGVRLGMGLLGAIAISKVRRKTLATVSGVLLSASMLGCAVSTTLQGDPLLRLICIVANVCASMLGFLQLPWIMSGELYPQNIRGIMSGTTTCCAYIFIFFNIKTFPTLQAYLTRTGVLYFFGCCSLLGALFSILFLPETNDRSLNEISECFDGTKSKDIHKQPAAIESGADEKHSCEKTLHF